MQDQPFLQLGFGVMRYFEILESLIRMMLLLTIFSIPIYCLYAKGSGHNQSFNPFVRVTLGNLRGAGI